ncbi:MAG: hypothetical protein DMF19_05345 [Verrucomicrobia bacterium]|nr:MAG: hypothetical protein DMF19_05345 [Verrucomicrobiota bacterium]
MKERARPDFFCQNFVPLFEATRQLKLGAHNRDQKRQRAGALQDASRISKAPRAGANFWAAAVFCRF